jgi:hypothetical protein
MQVPAADSVSSTGKTSATLLPRILQTGLAACFIGHGALGLLRTASWTSYFAVVGIRQEAALGLMPLVGAFDVAMGLSVLFRPIAALVLYMTAWCVWTAMLRPLAGESSWEAIERAGNYGVPLALFLLMQGGDAKTWLRGRFPGPLDGSQCREIDWVLRLTTVLLLVGHGALGLFVRKPMFCAQYALLGLPGATVEPLVGGFECLFALAVLLKPTPWLLLGVVLWKLITEALCPLAGSPIWVFVEHGGSYAAPLGLAFSLLRQPKVQADLHPSLASKREISAPP